MASSAAQINHSALKSVTFVEMKLFGRCNKWLKMLHCIIILIFIFDPIWNRKFGESLVERFLFHFLTIYFLNYLIPFIMISIKQRLLFLGWTVIRFWGKDIIKDVDRCVWLLKK